MLVYRSVSIDRSSLFDKSVLSTQTTLRIPAVTGCTVTVVISFELMCSFVCRDADNLTQEVTAELAKHQLLGSLLHFPLQCY